MEKEKSKPGVSGKKQNGEVWLNALEFEKQKDFMDEENQTHQVSKNISENQIIEALKRSHGVDIGHVTVKLDGNVVNLMGLVTDANELREIENIVLNVEGVKDVISHVQLKNDERPEH